mmetsp:Transcript_14275/g.30149  ORF Transcript_14275/g.30149 Transcript_14275/m.30149 type:complete len:102 (-) Transcript_14275:238-543(-)
MSVESSYFESMEQYRQPLACNNCTHSRLTITHHRRRPTGVPGLLRTRFVMVMLPDAAWTISASSVISDSSNSAARCKSEDVSSACCRNAVAAASTSSSGGK